MKQILALFLLSASLTSSALAASYLTEATLIFHKNTDQYAVEARVCRLHQSKGQLREEVIARPRAVSSPGTPASFFAGPDSDHSTDKKALGVTMDVSWPKPSEGGFAV